MKVESNKAFWEAEHVRRRSEFDQLSQTPSDFAIRCAQLLNPGSTILELGCGRGRDAAYFVKSLGATIFAVDISHGALALMSSDHPNDIHSIHRINASNDNLPITFRKIKFDAIYARSALYADDDSLQSLFKQFRRVLKPGGLVMLQGKTQESADIVESSSLGDNLTKDKDGHIRRVWEIYNSLHLIVGAKLQLIDHGYTQENWGGKEKRFLYMICRIFKKQAPYL